MPHPDRMDPTDTPPPPGKGSPSYRAQVGGQLAAAGFAPAAIAAMLDFDAEHFLFVRRVMKGDMPQTLMAELGTGLEASQFHALSAILRIRGGYGRPAPQEPTVGLLAEELCLDPSRASRIAADLVERGLVARAVSQEDGRRSILNPTERGMALMQAFLAAKWQRNARIFADWSVEDIETFARLFARYSEGMRREYPGAGGTGA
ncbi:MarR family winged helix-turn-helix transcriptional regulator [Rhodobacter sp. SGA-6-6]|uniref:MarR family winged helix-turn-helix transcriptional regulator n=1 Tax=Rhodobacter sp. SGA-6-6 TaxID=2710882 RepID=UPI001F0E84D8|nr:MarR family transcriptional regulator [Rhodobacter sp. SGA-6-6]